MELEKYGTDTEMSRHNWFFNFGGYFPFFMAFQELSRSIPWFNQYLPVFLAIWILVMGIIACSAVRTLNQYSVNIKAKGIKRRLGTEKRLLLWKDIAQIRLVRSAFQPGVYSPYGILYVAGKVLSEQKSNEKKYHDDVIELVVMSWARYMDIKDRIKQFAPKALWDVQEETASDATPLAKDEADVVTPSIRFWAVRRGRSFHRTAIAYLLYASTGIVLALLPDGYWNFIGWYMILYMLVFVLITRIGVYYRLSDKGIRKYHFPGICIRKIRWEDIAEAGFTDNRSVYLSTIVPSVTDRLNLRAKTLLTFYKGVVAFSVGYHQELAAAFAKYVPAEKWVR